MRSLGALITILAFLGLVYLVLPPRAYAYLDPGMGSYIIQIAIATLAGGTYLVVSFWGRIKEFFTGLITRFSKKANEEDK